MIPFTAYAATDSQYFSVGWNVPKLPLPVGGSRPYVVHGSLGPQESAPKRHLDQLSRSASEAGNHKFLVTLLLQKPKIGRIGERAGHAHLHVNITV